MNPSIISYMQRQQEFNNLHVIHHLKSDAGEPQKHINPEYLDSLTVGFIEGVGDIGIRNPITYKATTVEQIADHLLVNKGSICAVYDEKRDNANYLLSWAIPLDLDYPPCDIEGLLEFPLINDHCAIIHQTKSHTDTAPRSRAIFILDEPIVGFERFHAMNYAVQWELGLGGVFCSLDNIYGGCDKRSIVRPEKRLTTDLMSTLVHNLALAAIEKRNDYPEFDDPNHWFVAVERSVREGFMQPDLEMLEKLKQMAAELMRRDQEGD
jgi:hypothetical protein